MPARRALIQLHPFPEVGTAEVRTARMAASLKPSATVADPVLSKVLKYVRRGWPERTPEVVRPYWQKRAELTIEGN